MSRRPEDEPIEVDLPDGGVIIVSFGDTEARHGDGGEMIATALVTVDGSEGDLERAVVHEADRYGLRSSVSTTRRARTVLVETVPRREGEGRPSPT
ncbi:MAG TPA: hypothetical protein VE817_04375 [Candidatus Acidoferrum sp.]|nr:hypothetical protein [Candidatus Acidoferrum sp.]